MIKNVQTGNMVPVYFQKMNRMKIDLAMKSEEWNFLWQKPFTYGFEVFGLVTKEYPNEIQGLIALFPNHENFYV